MNKGVIYLMTTVVPGLIKIGKTGSANFESRMYELEHNGYRNVTALKRAFAIEVDDYSEKEKLLHTIFEKSQVSDTELFAVDINIAIQLLSSFEGNMIYPPSETKEEIFDEATDNTIGKTIPNGEYTLSRKKKSDNRTITAKAVINNGCWTIKKDSVLGVTEDVGVAKKAKTLRNAMQLSPDGRLLEDFELGECSPSLAAGVVLFGSVDGWFEWKNKDGEIVNIYRAKESE